MPQRTNRAGCRWHRRVSRLRSNQLKPQPGRNDSMPRPRSGLNVVRKKRPDGTTIEYFYDRKTGTFLGHDREAAIARNVQDGQAAAAETIPPGSMAELIVEYLGTPKYRSLSLRTRKLYRGYLDMMRREWGDLPIRGIRRGTIQKIKTRFETTPRKANQVLALFRILLKLAVDREYPEYQSRCRTRHAGHAGARADLDTRRRGRVPRCCAAINPLGLPFDALHHSAAIRCAGNVAQPCV